MYVGLLATAWQRPHIEVPMLRTYVLPLNVQSGCWGMNGMHVQWHNRASIDVRLLHSRQRAARQPLAQSLTPYPQTPDLLASHVLLQAMSEREPHEVAALATVSAHVDTCQSALAVCNTHPCSCCTCLAEKCVGCCVCSSSFVSCCDGARHPTWLCRAARCMTFVLLATSGGARLLPHGCCQHVSDCSACPVLAE